jgi:hypothetical protein
MWRRIFAGSLLALTIGVGAAQPEYPREIARWQEVSIPPSSDQGARMVWFYAANYSEYNWRVYLDRGQVCAQVTPGARREQRERPKFIPKAGQFRDASAFARVEDGWLVGFNDGEFGAALYWFNLKVVASTRSLTTT